MNENSVIALNVGANNPIGRDCTGHADRRRSGTLVGRPDAKVMRMRDRTGADRQIRPGDIPGVNSRMHDIWSNWILTTFS